jgi:hypothetical protein
MFSRSLGVLLAVLVAAAFLGRSAAPASGAEEGVVNALASWQGQGRVFRTGDQQALFVGAFVGIFFVENNKGVLHAAHILCPGALDIDLAPAARPAKAAESSPPAAEIGCSRAGRALACTSKGALAGSP